MGTQRSSGALARRFGLLLGAITFAVAHGQSPPSVPAAGESIPTTWIDESVDVRVITLDVTATDSSGRPITDLRREDFELREDGKPVTIVNFDRVGDVAPASATAVQPPAPAAPAAAASAAPPDQGPTTVLYFDDTHITPANRARLVPQLREQLLAGALGEHVALLTLDRDGVHVRSPLGGSPADVAAALTALPPGTATGFQSVIATKTMLQLLRDRQRMAFEGKQWDWDPPCSEEIARIPQEFAKEVEFEARASLRPLLFVLESLAALPGRKHLIYVSDGLPLLAGGEGFEALLVLCDGSGAREGIPYAVDVDGYEGLRTNPLVYHPSQAMMDSASANISSALAEVTAHANAANVALVTVQSSGLTANNPEASEDGSRTTTFEERWVDAANLTDTLSEMANSTGGTLVTNTNALGAATAAALTLQRQGYVLGFSPERKGDDRLHRLKLKTSRSGVRLSYRRAYRDESASTRILHQLQGALLNGLWRDPWGVTIEAQPLPGAVELRLSLPLDHVGVLPVAGGGRQGQLTLYVAVLGADGSVTPARQSRVPVRVAKAGEPFAFELRIRRPPGEHTVALLLRDDIGGDTALVHTAFRVAKP